MLFVLSLRNDENHLERYFYDQYYLSLLEINDFNVFIDKKSFFD